MNSPGQADLWVKGRASPNVSSGSAPDHAALRRPRHEPAPLRPHPRRPRRHLRRYPEDRDLVACVEGVDLPDSALLVSHEMEAIHRLEASNRPALVQPLTSRPQGIPPSHRAHEKSATRGAGLKLPPKEDGGVH